MVDRSEWIEPPKPSSKDRGGVVFTPSKTWKAAEGALEGLYDMLSDPEGVIEKVKAESKRRTELVDSPDTSFLSRVAKGTEDIVLGAAQLGSNIIPLSERRAGETEDKAVERVRREAKQIGKAAAEGMVVAPLTTAAALVPGTGVELETLAADPVGTALDILPTLGTAARVAKVGAKAAAPAKYAAAAKRLADVADAAADTRVGRAVTEAKNLARNRLIDNLAGTEVADLPELIRGAERLGAQLADEASEALTASAPTKVREVATPVITARSGRLPEKDLVKVRPDGGEPIWFFDERRPRMTEQEVPDLPPVGQTAPAAIAQLSEAGERTFQRMTEDIASGQPTAALLDPDTRRAVVSEYLGKSASRTEAQRLDDMLREVAEGSASDAPILRQTFISKPAGGDAVVFAELRPVGKLDTPVPDEARQALIESAKPGMQRQVLRDIAAQEVPGTRQVPDRWFDQDSDQMSDLRSSAPSFSALPAVLPEDTPAPRFLLASDVDSLRRQLTRKIDETGADAGVAGRLRDTIDTYQPVRYQGVDLYAPRRVANALEVEQKARAGLGPGLVQQIQQTMKSGLTSRSVKSSINNAVSNAVVQSVRRAGQRFTIPARPTALPRRLAYGGQVAGVAAGVFGGGPVGSELAQWATASLQRAWAKRNATTLPDDYTVQKWNALDKERLYDGNQFDVELKKGGLSQWLDDTTSAPAKALGGIGKGYANALGWLYTQGDAYAKAAEASRSFDSIVSLLDDQPVGKTTTFRGRDGAVVSVKKLSEAEFEVKSGRRTAVVDDNTPSFYRLVGSVAAEQGDRVFFNYNRTSGLAKRLRYTPIVGVGSPFYSWMSLAMDLPGKKGLLGHTITGPDFVLDRDWFTPKDIATELTKAATRDAMHGAIVHDIQQGKGDEFLAMLEKFPDQYKLMAIGELSNPTYVEVVDFGNWNSFAPTSMFMAGADALQAIARAAGANELDLAKDTNPQARELYRLLRKQSLKRGFTSEDALDMIGLGGSMFLDTMLSLERSSKLGEEPSIAKLFEIGAKSLVGATAYDAGLVGVGAAQEAAGDPSLGGIKTIRREIDPKLEEGFLQWTMRKFTGVGWGTLSVPAADTKKRWSQLEKDWKGALGLPKQKKELQTLLDRGGLSKEVRNKLVREQQRIERWEKVIDTEVGRMRQTFQQTHRMVRKQKQYGVKPTTPPK